MPTARLAVFAASFHWTDRAAVVRTLDRLLEPDGAIVVVKDALTDADQPDWVRAIDAIRTRYVGPHLPALPPHFGRSHHDVLADSPFSVVETLDWSWHVSELASEPMDTGSVRGEAVRLDVLIARRP